MNKNKSKNKKRIYRKVKKSKGGSSNSPFNKLGNSLVQQILNKTPTGTPSLFNHSHKINEYTNRTTLINKDRADKDLSLLIELRKLIFGLEYRYKFIDLLMEPIFNPLFRQLSQEAKIRIRNYYDNRGETPIFTYYQYIEYIKQFVTEYNTIKQNLINRFGNNNELVSDLEKNKFLNTKKVPISPHIGQMNQLAKQVRHLNIEIEYYISTGQLQLPSNFETIYDLPLIKLKNHPITIFVDGWLDNIFLNKFRWASDLPINTNELVSYNDILNNFLPWCRSR